MATEKQIEKLIDRIENAQTQFVGQDWADTVHDNDQNEYWFETQDQIDRIPDGKAREDAQRIYDRAAEDAAEAERAAQAAIEALREGRYSDAAKHIDEASTIESRWGDNPAYGQIARDVAALTTYELYEDGAGGLTLLVKIASGEIIYGVAYPNGSEQQVADDIRALIEGADVADWDGNDDDVIADYDRLIDMTETRLIAESAGTYPERARNAGHRVLEALNAPDKLAVRVGHLVAAGLSGNEATVLARVERGDTVTAIAREQGVSQPSVSDALRRAKIKIAEHEG